MDDKPAPPSAASTQQKPRGRPFQKGNAANPKGRPKGLRHHATMLAERLMQNDVPDIVRSVIDAAKAGDMIAAKIVVDRILPIRRGRPIQIDLPPITCVQDVIAAADRITNAVATGELTTEEGAALVAVIEFQRRAIEGLDLENRILAIERRLPHGLDIDAQPLAED